MTPKWPDMFEVNDTHTHTTYIPEFGLSLSTMSHFQDTADFWENCIERSQNGFHMFKVRSTTYAFNIHPQLGQSPNFRLLHCTTICFQVMAQFGDKCTEWPPIWHWHAQGQKCTCAYLSYPRRPNFRSFHSTTSHFRVMAQFWEKCTKWPPNDLDTYTVKGTHGHISYAPRPRFSSISLYDEPFFSCSPVLRKYTEWPQNDLDIFDVKSTHIHPTYTRQAQCLAMFCPFRSTIFKLWPNFQKNGLDMSMVKSSHMHTTYVPILRTCIERLLTTLACSRSNVPICNI